VMIAQNHLGKISRILGLESARHSASLDKTYYCGFVKSITSR
jgi:hypothetical protein